MEAHVNPYSLFIEVLSYPHTPARLAMLTGEMIAMHAELNQLFGRTKGKIDRVIWDECADKFAKLFGLCESAWGRFVATISGDAGYDSNAGACLVETFRNAVDDTRIVLDTMRREMGSLGETS